MMETIRARNGHTQPSFGYASGPTYDGIQFSDPWARTAAPMSNQIMASTMSQDSGAIPSMSRPMRNSLSTPFNAMPMSSSSRNIFSPSIYQTDMYPSDDLMKYNQSYAQPSAAASIPTSAGNGVYGGMGYSGASSYEQMQNRNNLYSLQSYNTDRRLSHPSLPSSTFLGSPVEVRQRQNSLIDYPRPQPIGGSYTSNGRDGSLSDALDSARGMMALSQTDTRLSMAGSHRNSSVASSNSYYPQSNSSSISSTASYPYFGSMDSSATEMSSTDGMYDSARPSLPRPAGMVSSHGLPHQSNAQAMMSTFSSRVSSSTQKKHKCKICDKRFTRPSSLQTHMYSHTGEKPFACDVDGCGRQFSVVSNLRRHRKVHKGLSDLDHDHDACSNASL